MLPLLKYSFAAGTLGIGTLYHTNPDLRNDFSQLQQAAYRMMNISYTAILMGLSYSTGITHEKHVTNSERLMKAFKANGGLYVKCGQCIAQLDLLVPQEYSDTMKCLNNDAKTSDFETVRIVVKEDLGKEIEDVFDEFNPQPIASASLAQVHQARLKNGQKVAVKIQHRWIRESYPGDIKLMELLINLAQKLFKDFNYQWILEDLKKSSSMELNFKIEAENCIKCAKIFKEDPLVHVPAVYKEISSERVLTMDFEDGVMVTDKQALRQRNINISDLSYTLSRAFSEMIFVHGFVHCDPHPGNILVRSIQHQGKPRAQIVLLDHGLYRQLEESTRLNYSGIWKSIINQDEQGVKHFAQQLGVDSLYPLLAGMLVGRTWQEIMQKSNNLDRLKNPRGNETDKVKIRKHAMRWQKEINSILGSVSNDVLLLFKTLEWLRAIEGELGAPLNTVNIIANYCTKENTGRIERWIINFKAWLYSFLISLMSHLFPN